MLSKTSTNTNKVGACPSQTRLDASLSLAAARQSKTSPETSQVIAITPSKVPVQSFPKSVPCFSAERKFRYNFPNSNSSRSLTSLMRCETTMRDAIDQQKAEKFSHFPAKKSITQETLRRQQFFLSSEPSTGILSRSSTDHHRLETRTNSPKMTPVPKFEDSNTNILQKSQTIPDSKNVQRIPDWRVEGCESRKRKHESTFSATPVLFSSTPCPIQFMCTVGEPVLMQDLMDQELPIVKRKNLFYRPALRTLEDNSIPMNIMPPTVADQIIGPSPNESPITATQSGAHLIKFHKFVPNVEIRR